jgi:hypothetical protein
MKQELVFVLLLCAIAGATLDQSYVQTVSQNGSSTIEKTMEMRWFSGQLTAQALQKMAAACNLRADIKCRVDVQNNEIKITEQFDPGTYYTYTTDYGFPYITRTLTINKVATDRFANSLDKLIVAANISQPSQKPVSPLDLNDNSTNKEMAAALEMLNVRITYAISMPVQITEASAGSIQGNVTGSTASFDLVQVLKESKSITVRGQELNTGAFVVIVGAIALIALAWTFAGTKPAKKKKK